MFYEIGIIGKPVKLYVHFVVLTIRGKVVVKRLEFPFTSHFGNITYVLEEKTNIMNIAYENKQSVDFPILASPTRTLTDGISLNSLIIINLSLYSSS